MPNKIMLVAGLALAATVAAPAAAQRAQIRVVGSSTVYPFTTAVAEQFRRAYPRFQPPIVESTGTGGGIKLFCSGVGARFPDVVNASRRIKAGEVRDCRKNGVRQVIEVQVGLDGVVLAESRAGPNMALTLRDVYSALAANPFGRPNRARTWRDVNRTLPAIPIQVLGPPPTSGTRDAFDELVMEAGCVTDPAMKALKAANENRYKEVCTRVREDGPFVEAGENDNLIVRRLNASPRALGVFGYSYLEENTDTLRGVRIDGVSPNYQTISNFRYPAARPLYIYVKGEHVRAVRGLREFVAEYAKESTWGPKGYLSRRGLVASPDRVRQYNAQVVRTLTPLNPAAIK